MRIGRYLVTVHNHGFFRLDGGAMFGSIPKALWQRDAPADDENRILLATRSLIVVENERKLIVDLGCGDKWPPKARSIFDIPEGPYQPVRGVTDVLITHFHFDHAGGISRFAGEELVPCYPDARHYVPSANLENARTPHARERASYLRENIDVLPLVETVETHDGQEIWPGLTLHRSEGHTRGLQWVKLTAEGTTVAFPTDLFPTSKHLPAVYAMGYDMCAETSMAEKEAFLTSAVEGSWIVVFEHDPEIEAGRIAFDDRRRPFLSETISL